MKLSDLQKGEAPKKLKLSDLAEEKPNPAAGMSAGGKFIAGMGKGFSDVYRGAKQTGLMLGETQQDVADSPIGYIPTVAAARAVADLMTGGKEGLADKKQELQAEIDEAKRLDKPLTETASGKAGEIGGQIASALPLMFVPGANTYAGAALTGAATGAIQPVASDEGDIGEGKIKNTAIGAGLGVGGKAAGDLIGAGYNFTKGVIEPFRKGGQENIVARALMRFGADPDQIASGLDDVLPGYQPTLAEVAQSPGISGLQRAAQNLDSEGLLAARDMQNLEAVKSAVRGIAGDDAAMATARAARSAESRPLYDAAQSAKAAADDQLNALMRRPSMEKAMARAEQLARESGIALREGEENTLYSGRAIQYLKMAMDDLLDNPKLNGVGSHEQRAMESTRSALVDWAEKNIPELGAANAKYAQMSQPINQMDVGHALYNKLAPALDDFSAQPGARAAAFAQALRNGDQTVRTATGLDKSLADVMTPEQMKTLTQAAEALARRASAQNAGRAVGSNTVQNLASQNLLRQTAGPLGLPESFAEARLWPTVLRPVEFAMKGQEPAIQDLLVQALRDPEVAKQILQKGAEPEIALPLIQALRRYVATPAALGTNFAQE